MTPQIPTSDGTPLRAWYAVTILLILYILSFFGRQTISLMVDLIQRDMSLSEVQIGLLVGLAFTLLFAMGGVVFGWLIDLFSRRHIIFWGTVIWCCSSILCGYAPTFTWLFIARMGVGIGEATLLPAAYSLLSDVFPRKRLATALGIFSFGSSLGVALSLGLGGYMIAVFSHGAGIETPFGHLSAWQSALVAAGIPGLFLGILIFTLPEGPKRVHSTEHQIFFAPLIALFKERPKVMTAQFAALAMNAILGYNVMAWAPAFMGRTYGWEPVEIGSALALVFGFSGLAASLGSGMLADWLWSRGVQGSHYLLAIIALLVAAPLGTIGYLSGSPAVFLVSLSIAYFASALTANMGATALQLLVPAPMRGRISGLYVSWTNVIGAGLGPLVVALITQELIGDRAKIGQSLAIVVPIAAIGAALILAWAWKDYGRVIMLEERNEEDQHSRQTLKLKENG